MRIDTAQFQAEKQDKVPLHKKGWQDALENVYPFKINSFRISDGDVDYVDANDPQHPLHVKNLYFTADNIRNLQSTDNEYPSPIEVRAVVFGQGRLKADGRPIFSMSLTRGMRVHYRVATFRFTQ